MTTASRLRFVDRMRGLRQIFVVTKAADPKLVPLLIIVVATGLAAGVLAGVLTDTLVLGVTFGALLGLTGALIAFGRRAESVQFAKIQGQPGAAAAVLQTMRGPWRVTVGVAVTRKKDLVHLVVGRPGVVLVGEGSRARTTALLKQQHRTIARAVGDVPVHEVSVGEGDDQVPLRSLVLHLRRMRRTLKTREVGPLYTKVSALGSGDLPLPKGPMPKKIPRR